MGIVDEDIAKVRESTDIVGVINQYTQLKRVGRRFSGLCPFHSERSPSFSVNAEEGLYYCFGCGVKGDAITFVREKEQLDFVGAVEHLASKSNIQLNYTSKDEGAGRKRAKKLKALVEQAVEFYHQALLSDVDAGPARSYLRKRGFDKEMVKQFKIGWSPDNWDTLAKHLGASNKDLTDAGLGFVNRRSRQQDSFRARVMFPIFDSQDGALGFGGRVMPNGDGPKYKNSSESEIYAKSKVLYGLNWAKSDIVKNDRVVICEGYTDVIGFHIAGMSQAVATCGTALTEDHVKLLKRFTTNVILAFDADSAGQNAALRFYEWEKKYEISVSVADIPDGTDPGELALRNPDALVAAVDNAKPFLGFRVSRLLTTSDSTSVEARARLAEQSAAMVAEHPDPLVRDQYAMEISSRLQMNQDLVKAQIARGSKGAQIKIQANNRQPVGDYSPETEALKLLVDPESGIRDLLVDDLFLDEISSAAYHFFSQANDLHTAIEQAGPEVGELLHKVSVETTEAEALDVAALLWRQHLQLLISQTRAEVGVGNSLDPQTAELHTWMRMRLEELGEVATQEAVVKELVVWLSSEAS